MNSPEPACHHNVALNGESEQTWGYRLRCELDDCSHDYYPRDLSNTSLLPREPREFVYQVKVRNVGEKEIVAIHWVYVFTDSESEKIVACHSFRTREHISPHAARVLNEVSMSPPTRVVTAQALRKDSEHPFAETIVVRSVCFSDGTVWRRPEEVMTSAVAQSLHEITVDLKTVRRPKIDATAAATPKPKC